MVGNVTKMMGDHTFKFGVDVRRAYNLRVPSDRHRSGELNFENDRTRGPAGGGLALASFMLGDVTRFTRYVSPTTEARERQWRHFYYAQDVWRPTPRLTLNYGLRLDIINPQTLNEPGNGGFLSLATGMINVAGVGDIGLNGNVENTLNWAPRLGATYQLTEKTVLRAGYGRSYDIGVFGSLFGHSVTQNLPVLSVQELNAPQNFESVFNLAQGPPDPVFPPVPANGQFALPNGVFARALPDKQRPPHVDAFNVTVQHQLTETIAVEAGYVGNRGGNVFAGDGPATNVNQAILTGFPNVPTDLRRPFFAGNVPNTSGFGGAFGWTQGIDYFCNCATNAYDSLQTKFTKRFSDGYSVNASYTLQRAIQDNADYFFFDSEMNRGPADWDRTHNFTLSVVAELPIGRERRYLSDVSPVEPGRAPLHAEGLVPGVGGQHRAPHLPGLDELAGLDVGGHELFGVGGEELDPVPAGRLDHLVALFHGVRHRLLDDDVLPGLGGGDRHRAVQEVGQGEGHDLHVVPRQEVAVVRHHLAAPAPGELLAPGLVHFARRHQARRCPRSARPARGPRRCARCR